jgi:multidrug efflux pump
VYFINRQRAARLQRQHAAVYDGQGPGNTTPLALNHTGLFPSVTVSFNLAPGVR